MNEYYAPWAPEYDDLHLGTGLYANREHLGWDEALRALAESLKTTTGSDLGCSVRAWLLDPTSQGRGSRARSE
jgi:hypothetical protein